MRPVGLALATLLALGCLAAAATARPLSVAGRRPLQLTTTFQVDWDLAYVPYPRLNARCGDLVTFRWSGATEQTVAALAGESAAAVLAACPNAAPLTEATTSGEYTAELLEPGTLYFVQPSTCQRGQVMVVNVACEEPPAAAGAGGADPSGAELASMSPASAPAASY